MEIRYFEVYLKDGIRFDFDENCNEIDYADPNYIVCKEVKKDNSFRTLAIIPRENVKYILSV